MLHLSARIAWHMNGWNGTTCSKPSDNTFCVGQYSYPGDMIASGRKIIKDVNSNEQCY
ncbi:MAG: hypothetical protein ABRQ39_31835 [Candidatus Eremiobacterota bacterium]